MGSLNKLSLWLTGAASELHVQASVSPACLAPAGSVL